MSVATKPASVRITEDMAAEQRLTVTDAELAEEIEIYVDMREGDMKGYDREVLLEAALRLLGRRDAAADRRLRDNGDGTYGPEVEP